LVIQCVSTLFFSLLFFGNLYAIGGGSGGVGPAQLVHQWKYEEGEREEEMEERRKIERKGKKNRSTFLNPVLHPPVYVIPIQ